MKPKNTGSDEAIPDTDKGRRDLQPKSAFLHYAWNVLFALFYPVLVTFSLLFTGIVWVLSGFSRLLFRLLSAVGRSKDGQ